MFDEYKALGCKKGTFKVELELPLEFKRDFTEIGMFENKNKMAECFDRILSAIRCKDVSSIWDYEREIIEVMKVAMGNAVLSSSEKPNKWIPTSERLPEEDVEVLATTEWGAVTIAERCNENEWFIYEGDTTANADEIKAWCELPPSYKAESEE